MAIANELLISSVTVGQAATAYSDIVSFDQISDAGNAVVLITTSAGSVTVTQQCSPNKLDWYDAENASGSAIGAVVTAMTVGTKYISYSPVLARYIRFKVVENNSAAAVVTLRLIFQEAC
jgi:hypothetical protein